MQLLADAAPLADAAFLTLILNFRHLVYGLSMLEKFQGMGWRKLYMIFSLTDETYALLAGVHPPEEMDRGRFYTAITALDQCYWVAGSVTGSLFGSLLTADLTGMDFAMTALFLAILTEQWREKKNRLPALLGLGIAAQPGHGRGGAHADPRSGGGGVADSGPAGPHRSVCRT